MSPASGSPRVTVIVQTYNQEKYIANAIESALAQQALFPFEVVVLDDGSTDDTPQIILDFAARWPDRIRPVLAEKNRGDNRLFMEAWGRSRADYVALVDGDDYWIDTNKLQNQVDFLDAHPECALSFHNVEIWSEAEGRVLGTSNPPDEPPFSTLEDLLKGNFIRACSAMIRRETVVSLPDWFNGAIFGDWPLFLLAMRHGPAAYLAEVMACYRQHSGGVWSGTERQTKLEQNLLFFDQILGRLGEAYDEEIRLLMVKRCYELVADRELGAGPVVPSPAPIREIEERLRAREGETALRVTRVAPAWRPERLFGASIDIPKSGATVDARSIDLAGWALGKSSPVEAVEVVRDVRLMARTTARLPRPDVAAVFPGVPGVESCGFRISVELPPGEASCLNLIAVLRDESRVPAVEIDFGPLPVKR